ncbi:DNA replication initiation factor cdc45 [Coemansia javaensis]|uniref:DNA replication initiation factor cdc45 n=1 Tax=Coemansia javaensis TaxID=2761396 RepID=A0A9W8LJU5_9FUNG|nr:DNA replication initiation factor cdc45 [Coemansia javaensis]
MVYVPSARYEDAYRRIVDGAGAQAGTSVVVFASADADSLCALRILTALLKRDAIGHKIVPVTSYAEVAAQSQALVATNLQVRTAVLLNCGAQVDIQDAVGLRDDLAVVVVDSHRPFNLYNIFWHDQVHCLDDGDVEHNLAPLREAFEAVEFGTNSDEDDDTDNDDDDDDGDGDGDGGESEEDLTSEVGDKRGARNGGEGQGRRRRRRRRADMDPDEFVREQERRAQAREARTRHRQLIQAYYAQGAYHGQSCAVSMLALAEQLGMPPSLDTVWWAAVGASSQHMLHHIDADGYAVVVRRMRDLVRRVCPTAAAPSSLLQPQSGPGGMAAEPAGSSAALRSSASQTLLDSHLGLPGGDDDDDDNDDDGAPAPHEAPFDPHLAAISEEDDEAYLRAQAGAANNAEVGLLVSSSGVEQRVEIRESDELRFTLLRHWSLDSAMRFSPYVATRLATWSSKGRARLDLLLAKLGLSRAEAQAPFLHLAPDLKAKLYQKMAEIGSDYNMPDALYPGFVRDYGWRKSRVSASDMVLALLALLQRSTWEPEHPGQPVSGQQQQQHQRQAGGFFAAYDALQHFSVLQRGIAGAQVLQRAVVSQGVSMLERQAVKTLRHLRFAILGDLESGSVFSSPFALRQLAQFLMQTLREQRSGKSSAARPFVIAAPAAHSAEPADHPAATTDAAASTDGPSAGRLLVLGITPLDYALVQPHAPGAAFNRSTFSGESRNHFGLVFADVAAEIGADTRQGFFDTSVIEIRRSDMSTFVDRLRRHL